MGEKDSSHKKFTTNKCRKNDENRKIIIMQIPCKNWCM